MQSLNTSPSVSIVLPIYNGARWIKRSMLSVLEQSLSDFELIVIDDGSVDHSWDVISSFSDKRILAIKQPNCGLAATLNIAVRSAQAPYIARQDQDDLSFPSRLQKQAEFLIANPDIGMVGTSAEIWVGDTKTNRLLEHPADDASIKFNLLFDNPFVHSSVMIRRSVFEQVGGYCEDKSRQPPEDYELWSRVAREFKVANLPEVLLAYREVPGSMSRTGLNPFLNRLIKISAENIAWYSGHDIESPEVVAISRLAHAVYEGIPRGIRFSRIEDVINDAATSIIQKSEVSSNTLDQLIKMRITMLQYHYYQYRTGGWVRKLFGERLERQIRSVARRIISVTQ
ncbi:glycosyltransferase family A protein [Methylobacillus sp. MM3]|uniref:glycosyltransferase family 2 protein n=1 Tax=Methylobacillus sp. MM3 TaxID=1848039 RepID=UPI0013F4C3C2|nr:glycosyltransferase family A protein [Methylobacillus sp. MM3]